MSGSMLLLGVLLVVIVLDLAAWRWGVDSTDGHDWSSRR